MYKSTKTYGHNLGLSSTFRQWRAKSHCSFLHGYALQFKFTFQAAYLDERNWVVDFGSLKRLKMKLEDTFDHKMIVAQDDPLLSKFKEIAKAGGSDIRVVQAVGCEAFAELAFYYAESVVDNDRVQVVSCECSEHGANSAIFEQPFFLKEPF